MSQRVQESKSIKGDTHPDLEPPDVDEKKYYIKLLNKYNEIKDTTQGILGIIANLEGLPVKSVYEKFELPLGE